MGVDGVTFEDNGQWASFSDSRHKPCQSYYLYLYIFAKSESKFSYLVGLKALRKYGKLAFDVDLPISLICGDPMRALTAVALEIDSPGDPSNERGHREDKRDVVPKASHYTAFTQSSQTLITTRCFKNRDTLSHCISNRYALPFLKAACALVFEEVGETNLYMYPQRLDGFDFIYMTLTSTGKVVNKLRVSKFRQIIRGENPKVFFHSMGQIRKYSEDILEVYFNLQDPELSH
eukprot:gene2845-3643_t